MDYLDTFDVDSNNKKCHRVRSWYLYEQYKSLERNQLDAAQLLKSKSYQNNILRQELKERRARRRLCDQYGLCQSESRLDKSIRSCASASTDELFESLCQLHEEHEIEDLKESYSYDGSHTSKNDVNGTENKLDFSDSDSVQSVINNVEGNLAKNVKQELEIVKKNIAKNINLQLETVKENIQCLKHTNEGGWYRDNNNMENLNDTKNVKDKTKNIFENLFSMWSNLVVFAYNSIQLNHGNCYSQCSSQLLTAILACDFLCRGVDSMCNILQSYVSPIKYATSDSESSVTIKDTRICECKSTIRDRCEKSYKNTQNYKRCSCNTSHKSKTFDRRCCSESKYKCNYSENRFNEQICRGASEPWRSNDTHKRKFCGKYSSPSNIKLNDKFLNKNHCKCHCLKDIVNPILRVARYIENILQELEDTPVWL